MQESHTRRVVSRSTGSGRGKCKGTGARVSRNGTLYKIKNLRFETGLYSQGMEEVWYKVKVAWMSGLVSRIDEGVPV